MMLYMAPENERPLDRPPRPEKGTHFCQNGSVFPLSSGTPEVLMSALSDLAAWKADRVQQGAGGHDPFVCSVQAHRRGEALQRAAIRRRFLSACGVLGKARLRALTIHHGRHTFISHALAGGRTLAEVRAAAGHSNLAVTSAYAHIVVDDEESIGNLFGYKDARMCSGVVHADGSASCPRCFRKSRA